MRTLITEPGKAEADKAFRASSMAGVLTPENLKVVTNIQRHAKLDSGKNRLTIGNLVSRDSSAEIYRYEINLEKF